ncbi:hypothetical protein PHMEG_00031033, partial [Phytophthora megakarya]
LDMRFDDGEVKRRLDGPDTNLKKRLAWQYCASRLSDSLNVILKREHVQNKYRKLKCEFRQGVTAMNKADKDGHEVDTELWGILNSAFVGRAGAGGAILVKSALGATQLASIAMDRNSISS